ncbi:hypothetical protein PGT21_031807 [Puccinia graminis f. sp. tritici]|uniref:GAF domain-containing protein n=1 Tax=Puccinia graminis f. sp. tritici TaxID=56615 RepID=A0A5B0PZ99_PUCGR|nr:hypothetical protein PGT21_031807 [Puccinia graminis f. sp. tritici]KAA1109300.1 hypothetical protein PGTUg99_026884 [Puccinia graminis f. sp. tritici]
MAPITAGSRGINLPYSSLFNVTLRDESTRAAKSRPPDYFWKKATGSTTSNAILPGDANLEEDNEWFDFRVPALSDSDSDSQDITTRKQQSTPIRSNSILRFTKLRRIAFKAFTTKSHDTNRPKNTVTSTEVIFQQGKAEDSGLGSSNNPKSRKRISIFKSLRFKYGGSTKPRAKKMVAVLQSRISADSPLEEQPKTWDEYSRLYASERINIMNPPVPPFEGDIGKSTPSVFQARYFAAPIPANEPVRQLVMNRLGVFGGKPYDETDVGVAKWKERVEFGSTLMEQGKAPSTLASSWQNPYYSFRNNLGMNVTNQGPTGVQGGHIPSETLEQHPVLRKIVNQCRELFSVAYSLLSVVDDDRFIFLAESGLTDAGFGGIRDVPREITFCGHTVLGDRQGCTILDARKDWRFENNPSVQSFGPLFYAGVPLMAPNLDGSQEAEENSCPIGSLCVVDYEPRESFSVEDRRRLLYMAEYARREIEKWFACKMKHKRNHLTASEEIWNHEVKSVVGPTSGRHDSLTPSDTLTARKSIASSSNQSSFRRLRGINSICDRTTSPSLHASTSSKTPAKISAGLFEDVDAVLNLEVRKVMDLATKLIGETLDLSLVYLTAVLPPQTPDESGRTLIISGHNIPIPVPVFDANLHLRALREPGGGLLYQNPSNAEKSALQPKGSGAVVNNLRHNPYASAMIFAVGAESYTNSGGFVLAGYTDDPKRVFGEEDVSFMKKFAHELSSHTSKLLLSNSTKHGRFFGH